MSQSNSHNSTDQVRQRLQKSYRSLVSKKYWGVTWRSLLVLFAGITTLIFAEQLFYLSSDSKIFLLIILGGLTVVTAWRGVSAIQNQAFEQFYRNFSRQSHLPELKDVLDLEKSESGNKALINAAILQGLSRIESSRLQEQLDQFIKRSEAHKSHQQFMFTSLALGVVLGLTAFNYQSATERTFTFWENYAKPNPYSYTITPGNITMEQGSDFQVEIQFDGDQLPEDVQLKIKTSVEEEFRNRGMEPYGDAYRSVPMALNNDLEYYIEMDGYQSDRFGADVQLRPRFTELQATIIPPDYTGLDSTIVSYPMSQIRAYQGSELRLSGTLNKKVAYLQLYTNKELLDLFIRDDQTFGYELPVKQPDTLRFHIEDPNGLMNENPFQVVLNPSEDEFPMAEIVEPAENLTKVNPQEIQLIYRASDDFGLTGAQLHYELKRAFTQDPQKHAIDLSSPREDALNSYLWELEDLNLKPRDELIFWVTVQDNDGYNGFKTSTSQKMVLRVPSMVDYFEDVNEEEDKVSDNLDEISKAFEESSEQYQRFKEQMKDNPENPGYEEKRELEQVQKQQEEVQKKIDELNNQFEQLKEELSEDNMLSEETQQAYQELEKLMKEIDDPAFQEAMKKLQEELGNMNPEEMRKAMENMEFNEELYRERLNRTIELFKQLKLNSDLDKLATSFEDMARKEADSSKTEPQLQQTQEENEKLKEQVESLSENTSDKNDKQISEFQEEVRSKLDEINKNLEKEMKDSGESSNGESGEQEQDQNGDSQESEQQESPSQQSRQQQYQQMAEQTRSMMKNMSQSQMNVNIAGLQYVLHSLLNLSLEQEDLTTLVASTENRSQAYISYARDQRNVEGIFSSLSDSLFQLSAEIPQFSNKINRKKEEVEQQLQRALEQMSERNQSQSSVASRQAMGGINDISFMLANLLEQLQNQQNSGSGSGGGGMSMEQMMEQLQQNGQRQQQLNQQLQEMINDMQGERLQQEQMERLNQIAKQQNQIRKQLQEIQRQGGLEGDRLGSELERMIEDMEDTINDLRGGSTDPIMVKRQQNILQRMLNAKEAMQERDEEDKREGQIAEEVQRNTPPELTLEELEKEIRNRLNDPNFTKYSEDYQRLIEKYFELLKDRQGREL